VGAGVFVAFPFGGLFAEVCGSGFFAVVSSRFPAYVGCDIFTGIASGPARVGATALDGDGVYATGRTTILLGLCTTFFGGPGVFRAALRA
jgi:hypothetical protein